MSHLCSDAPELLIYLRVQTKVPAMTYMDFCDLLTPSFHLHPILPSDLIFCYFLAHSTLATLAYLCT